MSYLGHFSNKTESNKTIQRGFFWLPKILILGNTNEHRRLKMFQLLGKKILETSVRLTIKPFP